MVDGNPGTFRLLGNAEAKTPDGRVVPWRPPHPHDTAYAVQAVTYPVVDGRLFVRGHDGLYCCDLRAPAR